MKKYLEVFKLAAPLALIIANLGNWLFYGSLPFLPAPLIAGVLLIATTKENRVYKFLGRLAAGSLVFGFLSALLTYSEMYLFSNWFYDSNMPFWPLYNPLDFLAFGATFSALCFMGGLTGIVVKGFYALNKK